MPKIQVSGHFAIGCCAVIPLDVLKSLSSSDHDIKRWFSLLSALKLENSRD